MLFLDCVPAHGSVTNAIESAVKRKGAYISSALGEAPSEPRAAEPQTMQLGGLTCTVHIHLVRRYNATENGRLHPGLHVGRQTGDPHPIS
jgi:hypothetical protein